MLGATDLAPTWQAKNGGGTPGTFTAMDEECSPAQLHWHGDFVATGAAPGAPTSSSTTRPTG